MRKALIFVTAFVACKAVAQQDPQYNLYQFNQLVINPAYAGARDAIAIVSDVRKQWVGFDGAPTTMALSVHSPIANNKVGIGLSATNDKIGAKAITSVYGNFSYILKVNNNTKLSFGARAGYSMYKFNFSEVKYKNPDESAYSDLSNANKGSLDVDAGLYLRTNTFYCGLSATHLNNGKIYNNSFTVRDTATGSSNTNSLSYILRPHMFFTIGKSFVIKENFLFSPSIMVKTVMQKTTADLNLNFFVAKRVWFGVFVRQGVGFGGLFQVYATNQLRIGYSYDVTTGKRKNLGTSHEIMIGFDIKKKKSAMVSPRLL